MIEVALVPTLGSSVSGVLTGFIMPVAELQPVAVLAAVGAFICGVAGIVLIRLLDEPRRPAAPTNEETLTAEQEAKLLEELRKAA
jgi:hypothetical protein